MNPEVEAVQAVLEAKAGAFPEPAARGVAMYKVVGKIFAIFTSQRTPSVILKCDPHLVEVLKAQYAGVGHRSHLDRRFWICVQIGADVPGEEIERLIGHSYDQVCAGLTRKQRAELAALGENALGS